MQFLHVDHMNNTVNTIAAMYNGDVQTIYGFCKIILLPKAAALITQNFYHDESLIFE